MKFETARIHFLSEVFIAVAFVVTSLFRAFLRFYLSCIGAPETAKQLPTEAYIPEASSWFQCYP